MKKLILHSIILLFIGKTDSFSQENGVFFSAGGSVSTLKIDGLSSFFTSYNDYFKNSINEGFNDNLSLLKGYSFMTGFSVGGVLEGGVGLVKNYGRNTATYNNGDKQILKFNQRDFLVDVSLGHPIIAANLGMMFSDAKIRLYYEHSNGVKDYHNQYTSSGNNWLNGFYKSWNLAFYTGIRIGIPLDDEGAYRISIRGDYVFKPMGGVDFSDEEPSKQSTPSFTGGRPNLPSDVKKYFTGTNAENTFNTIRNENSHFRLMVGFYINLGAL